MNPVIVIGLGVEQPPVLGAEALESLAAADLIIGGKRQLDEFAKHPAHKIEFGRDFQPVIDVISSRGQKLVVVLASGDPGFHGIAGALLKRLPQEDFRFLPNVSSLQVAFARIGLPWQDAALVSLHAHPIGQLSGWLRRYRNVGLLTDPNHTPAQVAASLIEAGFCDCRAVVAENLGMPSEQITDVRLSDLPGRQFEALNVLLLLQGEEWQPAAVFPYRDDEDYDHQRGLITKADVRALSLARLAIRPDHVVWDIGAGSGALSVEMAQLAWQGRVYAIERDSAGVACIQQNRGRFGVLNLQVVTGEAPDALGDLPQPQAVFIGGSGGRLEEIFRCLHERLTPGSRVVCNFATLENLHTAITVTKELGWEPNYTQVNIAHSHKIGDLTRLEPLNPVFIFEAKRA